jgi:hypothetical protein
MDERDYWAQMFGNDTLIDWDAEITPEDEQHIDRIYAELVAEVKGYEEKYGMTTEEFRKQWKDGTAPDTFETNAWNMLTDLLE